MIWRLLFRGTLIYNKTKMDFRQLYYEQMKVCKRDHVSRKEVEKKEKEIEEKLDQIMAFVDRLYAFVQEKCHDEETQQQLTQIRQTISSTTSGYISMEMLTTRDLQPYKRNSSTITDTSSTII